MADLTYKSAIVASQSRREVRTERDGGPCPATLADFANLATLGHESARIADTIYVGAPHRLSSTHR